MSKQLPLSISTDSYITFTNTFVSEPNRLLVHTLQQLVSDAGERFLFLWGGEGSGVTHLLEAAQNSIPSLSIQYLPLKQLKGYSPSHILEGVATLDVVCIDDLQEICGDADWEMSVFNLFNQLREQNKRLLIGSHLPPRQLPLVLPDLQSRLQWGTVFQLNTFSEQEKIEFLKFKATRIGMTLPDEVTHFLIQRIGRSIVDLVQVIKVLDRESLAEQHKLTVPFVKKVLAL